MQIRTLFPLRPVNDWLWYVTGFILLTIQIFYCERPPFYDEGEYLKDVASLQLHGLGKNYLLSLAGSAGPLYSIVHYIFMPLTSLEPPGIRLINLLFLIGVTCYLGLLLRRLNYAAPAYAMSIMAIPMTYVVTGMALTEMPAMFFFTGGIYHIISGSRKVTVNRFSLLQLFVGGVMLSLAVIGRQPYLVAVIMLPLLFARSGFNKSTIFSCLYTLAVTSVIPLMVFSVWGGLVPPTDSEYYATLADAGVSYRIDFFILCTAYFSIVLFLISPSFFQRRDLTDKRLIILAGLLAIANYFLGIVKYLPAKSLFRLITTSGPAIRQLELLFGSLLCVAAVCFIFTLIRRIAVARPDYELIFFASVMLLIAVSCVKITWGFTSRYAAQAIPAIIVIGAYFFRKEHFSLVRTVAGMTAGVLALYFYFLS